MIYPRIIYNDNTLTTLNLTLIFNDTNLNKLFEALKINTNITDINFYNGEISVDSTNKLLDLLDHNKTISKINMFNISNITEEAMKKIIIKLDRNVSINYLIIFKIINLYLILIFCLQYIFSLNKKYKLYLNNNINMKIFESLSNFDLSNRFINYSENDYNNKFIIDNLFKILLKSNYIIKSINIKASELSEYFIKKLIELLEENYDTYRTITDIYIDDSTVIFSDNSEEYITNIINYANANVS